jgi:DNA-damage-inducible protein J
MYDMKGAENMATTSVTFRMDEKLKAQAEKVFDEMGLNMTTAFTIFTKAVVRQQKIPFEISADPFYSVTNQAHLKRSIDALNAGKGNAHELIEAGDEDNMG